MAQCQIRLRDHPHKKSTAGKGFKQLSSDFGPLYSFDGSHKNSLIGLDISDAIAQITECEIKQQEAIGNNPTHITINGGKGPQRIRSVVSVGGKTKPSALVFKTQTIFGDPKEMVDAARDAYILLRSLTRMSSLTRMKTGAAVQNYMFYVGRVGKDGPGKRIGKGFSGFSALKGVDLDDRSTVSIIGPLTPYGRKLYWNPKGGKTKVKRFPGTRAASRKLGVRITGGFIGTHTMHNDVKQRMQRKAAWKAFSIGDPFFVIPPSDIWGFSRDINTMERPLRMPSITIQMKKRGRLR